MPHFMVQFRYSESSVKAMVANPQDRAKAAKAATEAGGGKLLCFFMMFGEYDGLVIGEFADNAAAASIGMILGASGAASAVKTTVLLTTKEAEAAMKQAHKLLPGYKPPHA